MIEVEKENSSIEYITIIPRNDRYCIYSINGDGGKHSKELEDMIKFLLSFLGRAFHQEIKELIYTFQSFLVILSSKEIIHLNPDLNQEREQYLKNIKDSEKKEVLKNRTAKKNNKLDNYLKQAENMGITNKFWRKK